MSVNMRKFKAGIFENTDVWEYNLSNGAGVDVAILSFGATVKSITVADKNGAARNILLGFDNWEDYIGNSLYSGASVAPVAGRIENARLNIYGKEYKLSENDGSNTLHGGFNNASFVNWKEVKTDSSSVTLMTTLEDGRDGFPADRTVSVTYSIAENGDFSMEFTGTSDALTYMVLTNHNYLNLSGDFTKNACHMGAEIPADYYVYTDSDNIGRRITSVDNTPFDFRCGRKFEENIALYPENAELEWCRGYDHPFIVNGSGLRKMIDLSSDISGIGLEILSSSPAIVIYSGGYIDNSVTLAGNVKGSKSCAVAFEPQLVPNAQNIDGAEFILTDRERPHKNIIIYKFKNV